jgi:hypothetical protein
MAYPNQQQTQQQPPKSARAASKAPLGYAATPQGQQQGQQPHRHPSPPSSNASGAQKSRQSSQKGKANANKIWSTSTTEERERIKEFWLGLSEDERRNLVKIEKDTVLKKMKEQQKHSCSCAVCGRKRCDRRPCYIYYYYLLSNTQTSTTETPSKKNWRYCTMLTTKS